jgi:hypothetical protein
VFINSSPTLPAIAYLHHLTPLILKHLMAKENVRNQAIAWFNSKYPEITEAIITSKFYSAQESFNKSRVWFFQLPLDIINPNKHKFLHLVAKNHLNGEDFLYFKVPSFFLLKNEKSFEMDIKAKVIRLYLSAEAVSMFKEVKKGSNVDFGGFLVKEEVVREVEG